MGKRLFRVDKMKTPLAFVVELLYFLLRTKSICFGGNGREIVVVCENPSFFLYVFLFVDCIFVGYGVCVCVDQSSWLMLQFLGCRLQVIQTRQGRDPNTVQ